MPADRPPRRVTPARLDNIALYYLQRFASSAENLRRVLLRRVEKTARDLPEDEADALRRDAPGWIDDLIERYRRSGLLDDGAFAETKARSLHRRGRPLKVIAQDLMRRGVDADLTAQALDRLAEDQPEADLAAALALARRKRLGPFRPEDQRAEHRQRDLAALGRAGFAYDTARQVIDSDDPLITLP